MNITLTSEQINTILKSDKDLKYQMFRDSDTTDSIDETSTFPERLSFIMKKKGTTVKDMLDYFTNNYPFLPKSRSSINHYLKGVRTPKLSMLFAMAEFLEVAPASLLPGVHAKYIEYKGDHVEMLKDPELIVMNVKVDEDIDFDSLEVEEYNHVPNELVFMDSIQEDNEDLCEHNNQINANCSDFDDIQEEETVDEVVIEESEFTEAEVEVMEDLENIPDPQQDTLLDYLEEEVSDFVEDELEEEDLDLDNLNSEDSSESKSADDFLKSLLSGASDDYQTPFERNNNQSI